MRFAAFPAREPWRGMALAAIALIAVPGPAAAHDGPPYPIVVDRPAGPFKLSVWADPDVGTGTFMIYVEPLTASRPATDCRVEVIVQPADGRLPEAVHRAESRRLARGSLRFDARVPFDRAEPWRVRFRLSGAAGDGEADTLIAVTPPGQGPVLDFVVYLFPFVAVAFLFAKAAWRRRPARAR